MSKLSCRHPDRDNPKLMCGYPLPCPWHTATLKPYKNPPTIEIPVTSDLVWDKRVALADIVKALREEP